MLKTRLISSAAVLACCAACSSPSSTSRSTMPGFGQSTLRPTEIVLPLNFGTHMRGEHETPARDTRATGQLILRFSADGQSLDYTLIASNISNVVASHIHQGAVGAPGPPVVFLYGNAAPGGGRHDGVLAKGTLTAANLIGPLAGQPLSSLVDMIQTGGAYANVHTNDGVDPTNTGPGDYPSGEIRGQLGK